MSSGTDSKWGKWVTSPALDQLLGEVNAAWPKRSKKSDGSIADHQHKPTSDHVPDHKDGDIVKARDFTAAGIDPQTLVRAVILDPHGRSNYVVYNRTIWDRDEDWRPRAYRGTNPHTGHAHVSVYGRALARDARPWGLHVPPKPGTPPPGTSPGHRVLRLQKPYMHGEDVEYAQRYIGPKRCGPADGYYGPHTERGVRWYQRMRGIRVDGVVGPVTWRHLLGRA